MLDHSSALLTLRSKLLEAEVCTTGETTLAATATGFTRDAGSFVTNKFKVGMEVVPAGFGANTVAIVKKVEALILTTWDTDRVVEVAAGSRELSVGIPLIRAWENTAKQRVAGRWYIKEEYLPGVPLMYGLGPESAVEDIPSYVITIEGPENIGTLAIYALAHEILLTFPPILAMVCDSGDIVRVRTDPAPSRSQAIPSGEGTAQVVITIPLIADTRNPI